ncbi:MAG TPA: alpha/beta fold hydrolase [Bacillales bacterium]
MEKSEQIEVKGKTLRGMIHRPALQKEKRFPAVILFHGFTGSKIDDKFMFVRLARKLNANGMACIRFDFSGSGESDGEFSEMTFSREVEEAEAILDFTRNLDGVDPEKISVLGFSMGGAIAAQIARKFPEEIRKLCLWSPAGNMNRKAEEYFQTLEILPNGNADLDGIELGRKFLDDLKSRNLYKGVELYKHPVLVIHGTNDEAVPIAFGEKYARLYEKGSFHAVEGADHTYSKLKWRDQLFHLTSQFFAE